MSAKSIILIVVDLIIFIGLLKLVFRSFKEVKRCIYYMIKPNILSIAVKDYDNDFNYTHRFLFFIVAPMIVIVSLEVYFFY